MLALMRLTDTGHGRYTTRGFTGHEMLDAVGIIHMNGRIYDPRLGRFMQADPVIQFPDYSQSRNRYSYVLNNPLAYTDPTGYIIPIFTAFAAAVIAAGVVESVVLAAALIGTGVFADSLAQGVPLGKAFLAGVSAASLATFPVGNFGLNLATFQHVATVATVGGITSSLQGGKFANGAMTAAFFSLVSSAAQTAAQRNFIYEGISPAEFEKRFGMIFEESRFEYENRTKGPFPLTKQDALRSS